LELITPPPLGARLIGGVNSGGLCGACVGPVWGLCGACVEPVGASGGLWRPVAACGGLSFDCCLELIEAHSGCSQALSRHPADLQHIQTVRKCFLG